MIVAKLASPIIISRFGEMISSSLFLAFVGHVLPNSLGHASFAWAFISLSTVVGIGFFSTLMIDVAAEHNDNSDGIITLLVTGIRLACAFGVVVILGVLFYLVLNDDDSENLLSPSGMVMLIMSLSIPAIYLQIVVFNYFNALGKPRLELIFVWLLNIILIISTVICIKSSVHMSMIAFALAYILLRWVLVLTALILVKFKNGKALTNFNVTTPQLEDYRRFLLKGTPLALCFGAESFLYFAFTIIAKNIGGLELSAYQATLNFLSIIYMISIGVGNATAILIAQELKTNRLPMIRIMFFEGLIFGFILLVPFLIVCLYLSDLVAGIYSSDVEVKQMISESIKIAVPFLIFEFIYVVVRMVLRSIGDSWGPTAITIFFLNGIGLSLAWVFFELYPREIKYLFLSLTICAFFLMISLTCRLGYFFFSGRIGNTNIVRDA
jgi:MATE family multidrug resistance protein